MNDRFRRPGPDDEVDDLERRLRATLTDEAEMLRPAERLAAIRAAAQPSAGGGRPWFLPLAAAAAVAAIALVAWLGLRPTTLAPTPAGVTQTPTPTSPPSPTSTAGGPMPSPAASTGAGTTAPVPLVPVALPVYVVAPPAQPGGLYGLVRQFVQAQLPADASVQAKANAALTASVTLPNEPNPNQYVQAWPPGTTASWVDLPSPEIGVQVSNPGVTGLPQAAQKLAVQALVWTVTAVAKQANAPVPVVVRTGGNVFEQVPSTVFKRPAADQAYAEISPIWVDSPSPGQTLPANAPVVVTGQACTFEANVVWELRRGSSTVAKGNTTATSACPTQGSWTVNLGKLAPGAYELRATEPSAQDGSLLAQNIVPFSVG